jgi:hypothetical protein
MIGDSRLGQAVTGLDVAAVASLDVAVAGLGQTATRTTEIAGRMGGLAGGRTGGDEHAERVAEHQAAAGWSPESGVRLTSLTARIAKLQRQSPVGAGPAALAGAIGVAELLLAAFALGAALTGDLDRADAAVLILLATFVPAVWAAWTLTRLVQHRRRRGYQAELDLLRDARGCGDRSCPECA